MPIKHVHVHTKPPMLRQRTAKVFINITYIQNSYNVWGCSFSLILTILLFNLGHWFEPFLLLAWSMDIFEKSKKQVQQAYILYGSAWGSPVKLRLGQGKVF